MRKGKVKIIVGLISMVLAFTDIIPTGFQVSASEIGQEDSDVDTDDLSGESTDVGGEGGSSDDIENEEAKDEGNDIEDGEEKSDEDNEEENEEFDGEETEGSTDVDNGSIEDGTVDSEVGEENIHSSESEDESSSHKDAISIYGVADSYAGGSGTSADPYLIANINQFNLFAKDISSGSYSVRYYKLIDNIYLNDSMDNPLNSWTPVVTTEEVNLDGNNNKICNLYIQSDQTKVGMFVPKTGAKIGSISNLTIENAKIECKANSNAEVGIFVGGSCRSVTNCKLQGDIAISSLSSADIGGIVYSATSIDDCTISGNIAVQNENTTHLGGIAYSATTNVENCTISEELTVRSKGDIDFGGIVYSATYVTNCKLQGNITINNLRFAEIGGIVCSAASIDECTASGNITILGEVSPSLGGIAYRATNIENCTISEDLTIHNEAGIDLGGIAYHAKNVENCTILGNLTVHSGNNIGIGGIVYSVDFSDNSINNCVMSGNILVDGDESKLNYVGGIVYSYSGDITACKNTGSIKSIGNYSGVGGIVYEIQRGTILGCSNEGVIESRCAYGIAAVVGNNYGTVIIQDCMNSADFSAYTASGIVGDVGNYREGLYVHIIDCYNEGNMIGTSSAAGVINTLGNYSTNGDIVVKNCYNTGDITGRSHIGGVVGELANGIIEECYNVGNITSEYSAGGIVGCNKENMQIKSCYNLGEITAEVSAGGISSNLWNGIISKCYNMGKVITEKKETIDGVGGIVGDVTAYSDAGAEIGNECIIEDCFNCGNIISSSFNTGGVLGEAFATGKNSHITIARCYNVGNVELEDENIHPNAISAGIGTVFQSQIGTQIQVEDNYYLEREFHTPADPSYEEIPIPATACSESQMAQTSTYRNWNFAETWKKGSRKYVFPILRGVGESYLTYGYGGVGQDTVFGEYILQAVNNETEIGVNRAVFSYQDQTVEANENGIIRILASNPDLGTVAVVADHYHDWSGEVTLQSGEITTVQMKPKKDINISKVSASGNTHIETGKTTIEGDTSNAVDVDLPIKIDLKFKTFEDKETGDNGASISDAIPVKVSWEGDTKVKISIGSETKSQAEYKYVKNLSGKWGRLPSEDVLKEMGKSDIHHISGKLGSNSVKMYLLGYMEIDFSSGSPKVVESGAVLGAEGEGSIKYRPAWAGTVAYGELKLKVGGEGKLQITFDESLGYFDFSGELKAEIKLTAAVGIGYEFAKGEVGAEGSLTGKVGIKKNWNIKNDVELKLKAVPYALLKIGFFNIKTDFDGWEWKWPETSTLSNDIGGTGIPIEAYSLMDRDYLESGAQNTMLFATHLQSVKTSITKLDIDGVYPEGEPQICSMTDGTQIAVWVADDGSKESADRTTIYYAVIKDDVITSYGPVYETGRGDYSPRLLAKGDSVYLAWMNADNTYGDSADINEYYKHISLCLSVFDGMSFGEPVKVTADGNHLPMLADLSSDGNGVVVTWVENSEDDAFFVKGNNAIYSRNYKAGALEEPKVIAEGLPYIYSLDSGYVNGTHTVVWSQDTDGDLTTSTDSELYMSHGGIITQLTDNTFEDINVRISTDDLYWCSDSIIRRMPGLDKTLSESIGIACDDAFDVLQGEMGKAVIWLEKDGFVTTPMVSYEKGDAFTRPIPLRDFGSVNISGYNAVYEDDGSIALFYDVKDVYEEWSESPYGQTNMRYTVGLSPSDILVDDYLYYDAAVTEPGQTLIFYTDVVNYTSSQINMLHLSLQASGEVLKEEDLMVELPIGGSEAIGMDYVLPQGFPLGTYMLTVTAAGVEENDLSNNQASAQVGYGNLALADCDIKEENDGDVIITGNIVNKGYRSIGGKTLYMRIDGQDGEVIGQIAPVSLAVNESKPFTFIVEESYIDFEYAYDTDYFYLSIEGDELETDFSDNSEYLVLQPILAESVELENDFQMAIGESRELTVSITPRNAYADCMFISSNLSVAAVDAEGTITAYGVGKTVITAVTGDGKASDSCTVTVTATEDEESLVSYGMSDTMVSLSVDEEVTLQIFAQGEEAEKEPVAVTWKSINEEIVTVEDNHIEPGANDDGDYVIAEGRIKALAEGSSVVIANIGGSEVVYCVVTVTGDSIKAAILEKTVYEMNKGESFQLLWESKPAGAQASDFTFTSSEEEIVKVDTEGKVYALEQGNAKVEMSYTDKDGTQKIMAACIIEVTDSEAIVYELRFDTNGGSVLSDSIAYQSGKAGYTFVFPETPTRPGYVFVGWNDMQDGSGTLYNDTETLIAGKNVLGDLTLYAVWLAASDGLWAAPVEDQVYTGSKLKPKVAVYDGTVLLTEGKDYSLSYKNNTNVAGASDGKKAPGIVVKGKGNYTGNQTIYFNILPRDIGNSEGIESDAIYLKANGKVQKSVPAIKYNGKRLTYKKNFQLEYPDLEDVPDAYKEPGEYEIKAIGIGNYTGERTITVTISSGNFISKASVARIKNQAYTGEDIEPQLIVKYGKTVLTLGTDYTVNYENNKEIGKATAIIIGQGAYVGVKKVTFTIIGGDIKKAKVTGIPKSLVYTEEDLTVDSQSWGTAPVLTFVVNKEAKNLEEGKDYTISYQKNNGRGTASIIFTGINGYSGTLKKTFKITAYDINRDTEEKVRAVLNNNGEILYAKGGSKPQPVVTFGKVTLKEKVDYTLIYKNNKAINDGTNQKKVPTVTIKGKGNFKGSISLSYTIVRQDLGALSVNVSDKVYQTKKNAYKSTPKITDIDGKTLKAGTDYEKNFIYTYKDDTELADGTLRDAGVPVETYDIIPAGTTVWVEAIGKGNYKGSLKGQYRVVQQSISGAKVTIPTQEYTGKAIKPGKDVLTVKLGKVELGEDDYEIVSYDNNVNKGKASIMIKGVCNYGGSKTAKFTIKAKGFLWW